MKLKEQGHNLIKDSKGRETMNLTYISFMVMPAADSQN